MRTLITVIALATFLGCSSTGGLKPVTIDQVNQALNTAAQVVNTAAAVVQTAQVVKEAVDTMVNPPKSGSYVVVKGDSLWTISNKPGVYNDAFLWPSLYKANRDQITDPDVIEVGQDLSFPKDLSSNDVENSHGVAAARPTYDAAKHLKHSHP